MEAEDLYVKFNGRLLQCTSPGVFTDELNLRLVMASSSYQQNCIDHKRKQMDFNITVRPALSWLYEHL